MQLAPEKRIRPPKIYGHKRLNLDITLVDADSGIVRATRQVSLSVSFSRKMCASVNRQFSERYLASWNLEDFQKRCREIYAEYPQSVDITRAPGVLSARLLKFSLSISKKRTSRCSGAARGRRNAPGENRPSGLELQGRFRPFAL